MIDGNALPFGHPHRQRLRAAFRDAHTALNEDQADALLELMQGRQGAELVDVDPPRAVAVVGAGDARRAVNGFAPCHTVMIVSADGRAWTLTVAGLITPLPVPGTGS